jgi:hypothetical protein
MQCKKRSFGDISEVYDEHTPGETDTSWSPYENGNTSRCTYEQIDARSGFFKNYCIYDT